MKRIPISLLWLAIALIGMALVAGSFIMVAWLKLQPCPLCIAQRTLFMLMGVVALVAFFTHRNLAGRIAGGLTVLTALSRTTIGVTTTIGVRSCKTTFFLSTHHLKGPGSN